MKDEPCLTAQGENLRVMERILVDVKQALLGLEQDVTLLATASVR